MSDIFLLLIAVVLALWFDSMRKIGIPEERGNKIKKPFWKRNLRWESELIPVTKMMWECKMESLLGPILFIGAIIVDILMFVFNFADSIKFEEEDEAIR